MIKAAWTKYRLEFKKPSGTSRGTLYYKDSYFLMLVNEDTSQTGIGECGLLKGLSVDDTPDYEKKLDWLCESINEINPTDLQNWPSIRFGLEMALKSLKSVHNFELIPSNFTAGKAQIPINGLIWMADKEAMLTQIGEKLSRGFTCIKLKIGAIDFEEELQLLRFIRKRHHSSEIEIRVDANGAFSEKEALEKLKRLSDFGIHSIEQPIKAGNPKAMAALCKNSPLPIALDEELIGIKTAEEKNKLLKLIKPQYIILKPSLVGGYLATDEWIEAADNIECGWWITSALESNIGLNAIAQYTYSKDVSIAQGLGTGELYTNNFTSPLLVQNGFLIYDNEIFWDLNTLLP